MFRSILGGIVCFSLWHVGNGDVLSAEPMSSKRWKNPVTLSTQIEQISSKSSSGKTGEREFVTVTPEKSPRMLRGLLPTPKFLRPESSDPHEPEHWNDEPEAPATRKIFRVSFPELFPTPAARPGDQDSNSIPPPPNFDIVDPSPAAPQRQPTGPALPEPANGPVPLPHSAPPLFYDESVQSDYVMQPDCMENPSGTYVDVVEPQTCNKWYRVRCSTLHSLFKKGK
ncbi:MAG TPA: hypothetical protein VNQ76_22345 [Planctomicrobium sp.]|nr:hypothetical protein [Planctomicrobium sp.]